MDAVVLALPMDGAGPHDELAGLPLVLRAVLALQKEGFTRVLLVGSEGVTGRVRVDPRVRIHIERLSAPDLARALPVAAAQLEEPFLIARHDVIVDGAVYRALRDAPLGDSLALLVDGEHARGGPLVATRAFATAVGSARLEDAVDRLRQDGRVHSIFVPGGWAVRITSPESRKQAVDALFEACRKPVDGLVARNLNRHISIFLSKRLVHTALTPNMMSAFTFALGVAAALLAARGGWANVLFAAFLLQWNSILDGVDGELARVRYQQSRLGQWLDTVSDDLSNVLFYAGLGVGAQTLPFGSVLLACGIAAAVVQLITMALQYTELARIGSGDLYALEWNFDARAPTGIGGRLLAFFRQVVKKDFATLFYLALAVVAVLPYFLPAIAVGQVCVLVATLLRRRKPAQVQAVTADR
jgi:phosphatidylglycerophosphate synthase